jgi:hypothetical protein
MINSTDWGLKQISSIFCLYDPEFFLMRFISIWGNEMTGEFFPEPKAQLTARAYGFVLRW